MADAARASRANSCRLRLRSPAGERGPRPRTRSPQAPARSPERRHPPRAGGGTRRSTLCVRIARSVLCFQGPHSLRNLGCMLRTRTALGVADLRNSISIAGLALPAALSSICSDTPSPGRHRKGRRASLGQAPCLRASNVLKCRHALLSITELGSAQGRA